MSRDHFQTSNNRILEQPLGTETTVVIVSSLCGPLRFHLVMCRYLAPVQKTLGIREGQKDCETFVVLNLILGPVRTLSG